MAELLFGAETEYAVAWRGIKKGQPPEQAAIELLRLAGERLTHLPAMNSSGIFLANGARFYVDCGTHPEYCTPECTDPWELVRQVEAGHRILANLACETGAARKRENAILCFRTNVDYSGSCSTWGSHESYLMRNGVDSLAMLLIPHLVTRPIYTGAGGFHPRSRGLEFTLAPRLTWFEQIVADNTTSGRGIWHDKWEPLSEKFRRLHVICGESLCSHTALFLKFGATALIVAMADAGLRPGDAVKLADPALALQTVIGDVSCKAPLALEDKRTRTAIEIQRHYLEMAEAHAGADFMPPWAPEVCRQWRAILEQLEAGPEAVAGTLDWAIKYSLYANQARNLGIRWDSLAAMNSLLELTAAPPDLDEDPQSLMAQEGELRRRQKLDSEFAGLEMLARGQGLDVADLKKLGGGRERMFEIDTRFGELGPQGIFYALDQARVLAHRIVAEDEIERAMTQPPASGRARIRGLVVKRLTGGTSVQCDWQQIINFADEKELDLNDPFASEESWRNLEPGALRGNRTNPFVLRARDFNRHPLARRERAFQLYERGDYRGAEELLRGCIADRFEVAGNRCHLARVLMMMDRETEAREEIALAWSSREGAVCYVLPRILFFRLLFAMLDGQDLADPVERIKHLLRDGDACSSWTIRPMLAHLRPRFDSQDLLFLEALGDALGNAERASMLDQFSQWRSG